jgi:hypothetical protein
VHRPAHVSALALVATVPRSCVAQRLGYFMVTTEVAGPPTLAVAAPD